MIAPTVEQFVREEFGEEALTTDGGSVTHLILRCHRGTLGDLTPFPRLGAVKINVGSEVPLEELARIRELGMLTLWDCDLVDIGPLAECRSLTMVELNRCLVRDLTPVLALPKLRWFSVTGCPLDDPSYEQHLPALWGRGVRKALAFPPEAWRITRKLNDRGAQCASFIDDYGETRVSVPGIEGDELGVVTLTEAQVDEILSGVSGDLDAAGFHALARDLKRRLESGG